MCTSVYSVACLCAYSVYLVLLTCICLSLGRERGLIAQWVDGRTEKSGAILTLRLQFTGAARDFLPRVKLSVQTFPRRSYSPRSQSHTSTSVRTLTVSNTGSHTTVWTHNKLSKQNLIKTYKRLKINSYLNRIIAKRAIILACRQNSFQQ